MLLLAILSSIVAVVSALYFYHRTKRRMCDCEADLTGKTAVITGANSGIGYEAALDLARRHCTVILACRRVAEGEKAARDIQQLTGNSLVKARHLDLCSNKSIRAFCAQVAAEEDRLDILVNNAGTGYAVPGSRTEDGLDVVTAANYLGHFLLTHLLLDLLKKSAPSRVVHVSSLAHKLGSVDLSNLNCERYYSKYLLYSNTKLYNILFSRELSRRLQGTGVTSNSLHPGSINTPIFAKVNWLRFLFVPVTSLFFRSAEQGAQTTIYCAVSPQLTHVSGRYFSECALAEESSKARDDVTAQALWDATAKLLGIEA